MQNEKSSFHSRARTTDFLAAGQKVGRRRYALIKLLGQGGMGVVWLAQDERLGEPVALKFLPPEIRADLGALDDLRRETLKSRKLSHPHIVRIHDLHEVEGEPPFISMEYVDGPTLSALRLQQPNRVYTWEFLQPLVQQLCDALDYAHDEKVIHRDLKPANILLARPTTLGSPLKVKLADFGIAAVVSDSVSRVSVQRTSGTLAYMSPQQLEGRRAQVTDDIYALGATLYELLSSKPPFYSGDITHQVLHVAPVPLKERLADLELANEIPHDVAALVMACLAKDPEQRPQSARAVAEWVGFGATPKPAAERTAMDLSSDSQPAEEAQAEAAAAREEREPSGFWKRLILWEGVIAAVLLLALGGWYWVTNRPTKQSASVRTNDAPGQTRTGPTPEKLEPGQRWTNSLGMVFVPVPGTEVLFCLWETRVQDFEAFVKATGYDAGHQMFGHQKDRWKEREGYDWRNPGFAQGPDHPVVGVNWEEAQAFCRWLTKKEQDAGKLDHKHQYRLPSDAEWSRAVGEAKYPWGDAWPLPAGAGNYGSQGTNDGNLPRGITVIARYGDGYARTSPVGSFSPNRHGLFDLGGNAWEWCLDLYTRWMNDKSVLAAFPELSADGKGQTYRTYRGGGWNDSHPQVLLSANRMGDGFAEPLKRYDNIGFRVVWSGLEELPPLHERQTVPASAATRTQALRDALVLHFNFDSPPANGVVPDLSPLGNHGRANGVRWTADGRRGGAYEFSGTNGVVWVSNHPSLNPEHITLAAWIKSDRREGEWRRIFDKDYRQGYALCLAADWEYVKSAGKLHWQIGADRGEMVIVSDDVVADGSWHHVTATYDGVELHTYVDGELEQEKGVHQWSGRLPESDSDLRIGSQYQEAGASFIGAIDEPMIFNRALSEEEVKTLCESQK